MNSFSLPVARRSIFAMLPALLTACSAVDVLNATVPTDSYRRTDGLAYGPDPRQQLDVYQPAGQSTGAPMVVFFYGGSWSSGDRADYRLSPAFRDPVFVQDSASAVRWAFDHAAEYGADDKRVFVMGHSAGAYNAAMVALDSRWLTAVGASPSRLAGWIGLAGPYDFLPIGDKQTQVAFSWPDTQPESQPIVHASSVSPPALLLAPQQDSVVDPQRSTAALARQLQTAGVRVESALYAGVSHVTLLGSMAYILRSRAPVMERVTAFVQAGG